MQDFPRFVSGGLSSVYSDTLRSCSGEISDQQCCTCSWVSYVIGRSPAIALQSGMGRSPSACAKWYSISVPTWIPHGCTDVTFACLLGQERPNAAWQLHTYITYTTGTPAGAAGNEILTYGHPQSLRQFCDQAQMANFVQYR